MTRTAIVSTLVGLLLAALAGPALAQAQPYPPPQITVTTPESEIVVRGDDWGGATVTVTARDTTTQSSYTLAEATVSEDGTFEAPVRIPSNFKEGTFVIEVSGIDATGAERTDQQLYAISDSANASDVQPLTLAEDDGGITRLHVLLAIVVAGLAGLVLRRVRRTDGTQA